MNIQVHQSFERQLYEAHKARQARLWGKPAVVNVIGEAKESGQANEESTAKTERKIRTPLDFVKAKCEELGSTYEEVTAAGRLPKMVEIRRRVLRATHERYPGLSYLALSKLVKRDSTSVMYALGLLAHKDSGMNDRNYRDRKALALYLEGVSMMEIAVRLGVSLTTIKLTKARNKWEDRTKAKPKNIPIDHVRAHELYNVGMAIKEIAYSMGVTKSAVYAVRKRHGWDKGNTDNGE